MTLNEITKSRKADLSNAEIIKFSFGIMYYGGQITDKFSSIDWNILCKTERAIKVSK